MSRLWMVALVVVVAVWLTGCCCFDPFTRNFDRYLCRSKQREAKSNLKSLYVAEQGYRAEHHRFGPLEDVGFEPSGEKRRYEYVLTGHDEDGFVAEARGIDEMTGDLWQVDETGELRSLRNVCGNWQEGDTGSAPLEVSAPDPTKALEVKRAAFRVRF